MQPKDKIGKASWNHFEASRDSVIKNIVDAIRDGKIKVEASTVPQLLSLIGASLEEGYHKGYRIFEREVVAALGTAAGTSVPSPTTKKK